MPPVSQIKLHIKFVVQKAMTDRMRLIFFSKKTYYRKFALLEYTSEQ